MKSEQMSLFEALPGASLEQFTSPSGYSGLSAFHKYWGKKPIECMSYLIDLLTAPGDLVVDPFMGSGLVGREVLSQQRRFIGMDINPVAVEMARLQLQLPHPQQLAAALDSIQNRVLPLIDESYRLPTGEIATHYLWDESDLRSIWIAKRGKGARIEMPPTPSLRAHAALYSEYQPRNVRELRLFTNSRINTSDSLTWGGLFTGRALRNIDLLISEIRLQSPDIRRALLLSLTSASGQMSRMVFAITGRGKTSGKVSQKIEVGSWVIGYWRPKLHFEINVWRCFERRAKALVKSIEELQGPRELPYTQTLSDQNGVAQGAAALLHGDCKAELSRLPSESVALLLTDPPHSDRIPYLEMSEMWNALMGLQADFASEIVVSNAKARGKTRELYLNEMRSFIGESVRVLRASGVLCLIFNARDSASWQFLDACIEGRSDLELCGSFPMAYSASSVVQDNRKGSMKSDYILLYVKKAKNAGIPSLNLAALSRLPGWASSLPARISLSAIGPSDE